MHHRCDSPTKWRSAAFEPRVRILKVADVPDNRTGGMSRAMYGAGDALVKMGHTVDYAFNASLDVRLPLRMRRLVVPFRVPLLVQRLARAGRRYDVVEIHEP